MFPKNACAAESRLSWELLLFLRDDVAFDRFGVVEVVQ